MMQKRHVWGSERLSHPPSSPKALTHTSLMLLTRKEVVFPFISTRPKACSLQQREAHLL